MTSDEAIKILSHHNKWRRDRNEVNQYEMNDPTELGIAIDFAIEVLKYGGLVAVNDLGGAIMEKLEFNATRPDHKPKNRAKEGGNKF